MLSTKVKRNTRKANKPNVIWLLAFIFLQLTPCFAEEPFFPLPSFVNGNGSDDPEIMNDTLKKTAVQTRKRRIGTADERLSQHKEHEWARHLKAQLHLPDWIDLGIENRTRFESYDHPWRTNQKIGAGRTDPQIALRSRIRIELGGQNPLRVLFEGQDARAFMDNDSGDFRDTTSVNEWDILQLLGLLTTENILGTGLRTDFHFGRMTLDFGRRRFIARNDFRNTTNAFDGFHWQIGRDKIWRVRAFLVEPVIRDDVSLDKQNTHSLFWGTYAESVLTPWFTWNAYYFGLNDQASSVATQRTYSTFGGRIYKSPAHGELDYEVESAWQIGTRGVTDHFAHFQHLDIGFTFNLPWSPRILFHYDYASGDRTPTDNTDQRFDTLFGARRFEYMPSGIFGPFFRTNLNGAGWRMILQPATGWKIQVKQRFWFLAQSKDSFGSSGLRDPTGHAGTNLGSDVEFRVQWIINQNVDFDVGYDHWFKGSYFDKLPNSADLPQGGHKDTDYFYLSMRIRL